MINELFELYRRNFGVFRRDENTVREILGDDENTIITERDGTGNLVGASVINENTVLMLAVDKTHRGRGIGSSLLEQSEKLIKHKGYGEIRIGAGRNYLLPGVPTSKGYYPAEGENLYHGLDCEFSDFFENRGYAHSWDCSCFDMLISFDSGGGKSDFELETKEGVSYRWAREADIQSLCDTVRVSHPSFCRWYERQELYDAEEAGARVLMALVGEKTAGAVIVSVDKWGTGSVGCTVVLPELRHRGIAAALVKYGTQYLRNIGAKESFVGYTYTGLDRLYGSSGYKICTYYMMAKKNLS